VKVHLCRRHYPGIKDITNGEGIPRPATMETEDHPTTEVTPCVRRGISPRANQKAVNYARMLRASAWSAIETKQNAFCQSENRLITWAISGHARLDLQRHALDRPDSYELYLHTMNSASGYVPRMKPSDAVSCGGGGSIRVKMKGKPSTAS